jgi:phosphatidylglycerophosphate synthase
VLGGIRGPVLTRLKEKVQGLLAAEARVAHGVGLTPNWITVLGLVLAFFAALFYGFWGGDVGFLMVATFLLLVSGFCDALDGVVARVFGEVSVFGGFLDSLLDRYADAVVFGVLWLLLGRCL